MQAQTYNKGKVSPCFDGSILPSSMLVKEHGTWFVSTWEGATGSHCYKLQLSISKVYIDIREKNTTCTQTSFKSPVSALLVVETKGSFVRLVGRFNSITKRNVSKQTSHMLYVSSHTVVGEKRGKNYFFDLPATSTTP